MSKPKKTPETAAAAERAKAKAMHEGAKNTVCTKVDNALNALTGLADAGRLQDGGQIEAFKKKMREQVAQFMDATAVLPEA